MIEIKNVSKAFEEFKVLDDISMQIEDGTIFGIVGSNGAGKSTLLRMMSGVYDTNLGSIIYDGIDLGNKLLNTPDILFLSDEMYYEANDTIMSMAKRYKHFYRKFNNEKFGKLLKAFNLDKKTRIDKLSKGMRKQAILSVVLACEAKYLFLDETLDGLDPVMRMNAKKMIFDETVGRQMTTVITSHSLRELEDMCDNLAMLHKGKIILQGGIDNLRDKLVKVRCAFDDDIQQEDFKNIDILDFEKSSKLYTIITRGEKESIHKQIARFNPVFIEILSVSIEETFVIQLKILGYGNQMDRGMEE